MANNLNLSTSPYLQQHADNPVNWQRWSSEIIDRAKKEHKPILVSIGYSTCHWCHVMAHESFENHLTAEIMNEHFINVKIDREERPDLDHYFMNAVQAMGISGGWPLHCFLTEDGRPFYGGTYFPPEPKFGRPSWNQTLLSVAQAYQDKAKEIFEQARELNQHLEQLHAFKELKTEDFAFPDPEQMLQNLMRSADRLEGGFGSAPKFPQMQLIQLLLSLYYYEGNEEAARHALVSLQSICAGGIFDHVAGGFCRYSVDGNWNVPHFEKMLYDHAQICETLFQAYKLSKEPYLKIQAERSLVFFETCLKDPSGYFYSAMDADSDGEEGKFYVWETEELKSVLESDLNSFTGFYEWSPLDHVHPHKKVIRLKKEALETDEIFRKDQVLHVMREKLRQHRELRKSPSIDRKGIISWNAMLVACYAEAYKHTLDPEYKRKALDLTNTLMQFGFYPNRTLCRYLMDSKPVGFGYLEDYAFLLRALFESYQISFEMKYLEAAEDLLVKIKALFKSTNSVLFKMASGQNSDFGKEMIEWTESTYQNPNSIICSVARYLYQMTNKQIYRDLYSGMLDAMRPLVMKYPHATASWAIVMLQERNGVAHFHCEDPEILLKQLNAMYLPGMSLQYSSGTPGHFALCEGQVCYPPVSTIEELKTHFANRHVEWRK
ncbi:MAG: thioredoxin domain-containing protein [Saprospiraceae bacterium]|nr:thioredoxin domain-containing protein [Saprospiraceae bacterium]